MAGMARIATLLTTAMLGAGLAGAMPAVAGSTDARAPIDPVAQAALQAALGSSPAAIADRGGTAVTRWSSFGRKAIARQVVERDEAGRTRTRMNGISGGFRTEYYSVGARTVAHVPRAIQAALARHGLHRPPAWFAGASQAIEVSLVVGSDHEFSLDPVGDLRHHLVTLSATSADATTTYAAGVRLADGTVESITVESVGGLVTTITASQVELRYRYGHEPIAVPAATRRHRALIETELRLGSLARGAARMVRTLPRSLRVDLVRQLVEQQRRYVDKRIRVRDVPGGVELTRRVRGWDHPLTWRCIVSGKPVTARPVRTA